MAAASPSVEASWGNSQWYGPNWTVPSDDTTAGQWYIDDVSTHPASVFCHHVEGLRNDSSVEVSRNFYQSWGSTKATWGTNSLY